MTTIDALGRVTHFSYDTAGNVTSITDPAQHTRQFTYDPTFNRVTSITEPPVPGSPPIVTTFEYDALGFKWRGQSSRRDSPPT